MKIVAVVFSGGISTLGMDVIINSINGAADIELFNEKQPYSIKTADVILFSLNWFDDILAFCKFLKTYGVKPKNGQTIIIGGSAATNPRILSGLFDYAVLGDGEVVMQDLIESLKNGDDPSKLTGVVKDGAFESDKLLTNKTIPANAYIEDRGNNTARIEIARGCRFRCPFCQIGHIKPYREQPIEIVEHLLKTSPTKSVGLFAPDRSGYSKIKQLEQTCRRLGKHNTAEDMRLDSLKKIGSISKLKFGVEGFSERTRKEFKKVKTNSDLVEGLRYIFQDAKKPNGKKHTTATVYMIGDLPGESPNDTDEFYSALQDVDRYCSGTFTMFLTMNSFSPKPFTPYARKGIHPYSANEWNDKFSNYKRLPNITIASRGGLLGPANRITHCLTARGDERLTKLVFWLANDGNKLFKDRSYAAGKTIERLIKKQGVNPEFIYGELSQSDKVPTDQYTL